MGFNVFGFLLPGLLAAGVAWELRRAERVAGVPTRSSIGLLVYGMMLALTAVPADIEHMFQSPWTWVHAFFVTAPVPLWAVVLPGCAKSLRVLGASRHEATLFLVLGYLVIAEFLLYAVFESAPGMVQRLMITTGHLSIAWLSWVLLGIRRANTTG
jgi:hypothetical protein